MSSSDDPADLRRPASTRGRPRSDERTEAILESAAAVLVEAGYDKLRIQDVADRAGAGTGAIYRRWSTKEDLVAEAILSMEEPEVAATDDAIADLRTLIEQKAFEYYADPDLLPGMITAMRAHPVIAEAVHDRYTVDAYRDTLARIMGDDNPFLDLVAELAPAIALHRISFGSGVDGAELADQILALAQRLATD